MTLVGLVTLAGCVSLLPLQQLLRETEADLERFESGEMAHWGPICASRELALARAHHAFAKIELGDQADARRGGEHLVIARENARIAVQTTVSCIPRDRDNDGVTDEMDNCPDDAEDKDDFQDSDGCPDLDNDGDGLVDSIDDCPNKPEDLDGYTDSDGCPDPDNDQDGVPDLTDDCPNDPEDLDGVDDEDGCPDLDRDGDGISDALDQCPDQAETFNEYLDEDGCPDSPPQKVRITKKQIIIEEKIQFEVARSTIRSVSHDILNSVAQVMRDYPHIDIRIEGHTDSDGSDSYNLKLSQGRATAVHKYLVGVGIDADRLEATGYGETRPIDTNRTSAGKANNRRVEFHIVEGM
ncbi:MAG: OmpA family protein [Myxococcota bacterium]|nr:OmpA family protein [Myxococcota bacterium]